MAKIRQATGVDSKVKFAKSIRVKSRLKTGLRFIHVLVTAYLLYCNLRGL